MSNSLQRRRRAGLLRPVMTPVRKPAVTASVRPWPSWASKFFSSSAEPSDCESSVTLPSVSVPSTSISRTRIGLARFASLGGIFLPRMAKGISSSFFSASSSVSSVSALSLLFSYMHALHQLQGPQIVQVHHAEYAFCFVHDDDGSDLALFHQIQGFAGDHVRRNGLRIPGHAIHRAHFEHGAAMFFHQAAKIAVGQDPRQASIGFEDRGHAEFLGRHLMEDVGHRRVFRNARQRFSRVHEMFHAQKFLAETSRGMERGEIIGAKSAAFEERNSEGVANGHGYRGARRRRKVHGAGFFLHAHVQHYVAGFGERGMKFASQSDQRHFEPLQSLQEANDFFGLPAVGDCQYRIAARKHAHVSVQSLRGVQEKGRSSRAGKCCRDFPADEAGFSHASHNDASFAGKQDVYGFFEIAVQTREHILNGLRFNSEHAPCRVQAHFSLQRRTTELSPFNFVSKLRRCDNGRAFGPSESALAGLSCVSRKIPSTPAATPARASGSMNCGWPPLAWPCPPGSCTECVTSKTTG